MLSGKNLTILLICSVLALNACAAGNSSSSGNVNPDSRISASSPAGGNSLSSGKVEAAANQMVGKYRIGGRITVEGVREISKENSAVADLRFDSFEFATSNDGAKLLEASQYKPPADLSKRSPTDPLPSMEEMFPNRKQNYNGKGTAALVHYTDGRWVLKEVRWGSGFFSFTVTGNINLQ